MFQGLGITKQPLSCSLRNVRRLSAVVGMIALCLIVGEFEVPIISRHIRLGTSNSKSRTIFIELQVSFDSEVRSRACRELWRTSESGHLPRISLRLSHHEGRVGCTARRAHSSRKSWGRGRTIALEGG